MRFGRADHGQPRNAPQHRDLFDRLVGRTVFTDIEAVVGEHVDFMQMLQRGEADRRLHIIAEHEEGRGIRDRGAVQRHAVARQTHREFTHAEVHIASRVIVAREIPAVLHVALGRRSEVRRAAEKRRNQFRRLLQHRAGSGARGDRLRHVDHLKQFVLDILRNRAVQERVDQLRPFGIGFEERLKPFLPVRGLRFQFFRAGVAELLHLLRNRERLGRHIQVFAQRLDLFRAERLAVSARLSLFVRRAEADSGLADDQGRTAVGFDRLRQRRVALRDVVGVVHLDYTPVVGGEPGGDILAEREVGAAFD